MCRGHVGSGHEKRRTKTWSWTDRSKQGKSARWRVYRLWTRRASEPQLGQAAVSDSDRQVDGQIVEVKRAIDQATLDGNREEFEWKQQKSPWMQFDRCESSRATNYTSTNHQKCGRTLTS